MNRFLVKGNTTLHGEIEVHGAKNAALPILAASVLAKGESIIHNCPNLADIEVTLKILSHLGCVVKRDGNTVCVDATNITAADIPEDYMCEMRSSIIFLPAVLMRTGSACMCYPGGCDIGVRPIDLHLSSLRKMGAAITENGCEICCFAAKGLKGSKIILPFPSVGATESIMIAAAMSKGTTIIINAAREPEIMDLASFLNKCGAKIHLDGEGTVEITGVKELMSCEHEVISDRIVASTYMSAAVLTKSELRITKICQSHLSPIYPIYSEMGCKLFLEENALRIVPPKKIRRVKEIKTMPYPGFPTDSQALVGAVLTQARGTSIIYENIFENRFRYLAELSRMGADVSVSGKLGVINGVKELHGASVKCTDLRGGAALMVAALSCQGDSVIGDIYHIERGYENLDEALNSVGAKITRIQNEKEKTG